MKDSSLPEYIKALPLPELESGNDAALPFLPLKIEPTLVLKNQIAKRLTGTVTHQVGRVRVSSTYRGNHIPWESYKDRTYTIGIVHTPWEFVCLVICTAIVTRMTPTQRFVRYR